MNKQIRNTGLDSLSIFKNWGIPSMKSLLTALLLGLTIAFASSAVPSQARAGGSDGPFPMDFPLPFPWDRIDGLWMVQSQDFQAMFRFEGQSDCYGRQILKVRQINSTGNVVAMGIGVYMDSSKQVYAAMKPVDAKIPSYMLYVGLFKDTRVLPSQDIYILRISSFDGSHAAAFRIQKFSGLIDSREDGLSCPHAH